MAVSVGVFTVNFVIAEFTYTLSVRFSTLPFNSSGERRRFVTVWHWLWSQFSPQNWGFNLYRVVVTDRVLFVSDCASTASCICFSMDQCPLVRSGSVFGMFMFQFGTKVFCQTIGTCFIYMGDIARVISAKYRSSFNLKVSSSWLRWALHCYKDRQC